MDIFNVLSLIGGLALFLFGMMILSEALESLSGSKLKSVLEKLMSNRLKGLLVGMGVTAVIQSSSATTVMVVGFVNSGIMKLSQAIGVIMGANIGTTITAWLLSLTQIDSDNILISLLKPSSFSPILAAIGIIMLMGGKSNKRKDIARILLGFATLMFGMETMSAAVAPLSESETFRNIFILFSNPVYGVLAGALITAIIQSSSASVGILQALSSTGAITMSSALPIIMGQNIGTCVTALISSVGAKKNARRAALIHLYFNIIGVAVILILFYVINAFVNFAFMDGTATKTGIALIHTAFNVIATIVLFPFAGGLEKLAYATIKGADENDEKTKELLVMDEKFLTIPSFAIAQCRELTVKMADMTYENFAVSVSLLGDYKKKKAQRLFETESVIDVYEDKISGYLVLVTSRNLSAKDSADVNVILHCVGDLERISDHAVNITETAANIDKEKLELPGKMKDEFGVYAGAVKEIMERTIAAFKQPELTELKKIEPLEDVIDNLERELRKRHLKRMRKGKYDIDFGFVLSDLLTNLERIADHCSNIGVCLIQSETPIHGMHEYVHDLNKTDDKEYIRNYNYFNKKYSL